MMKRAAVAVTLNLPLLFAAAAHADDTQTTTAGTLVVVTPSAPIIVQSGGAGPSAAPVVAAPGAAAPTAANGAPQNEAWSNVSHINGVPIKVGERGDYLYKFKRTNLSANPFGLFFGYYDAAGSYAVSPNLAVSLAITGWNVDHGNTSGYQATASVPIYFRRTYSGPFLEPGLIVRSTASDSNYLCANGGSSSCATSGNDTWAGPELLFGWHWTFDSGLNIAWAFGVTKHLTENQMTYSDHQTEPVGYFRVGYAF